MGEGGTAAGPEGRPQLGKKERMHLVPDGTNRQLLIFRLAERTVGPASEPDGAGGGVGLVPRVPLLLCA